MKAPLRDFVASASDGPEPVCGAHNTSPRGSAVGQVILNEELRVGEARYRTLFEAIDEGFCIIERVEGTSGEPSDFRYIEANPAFRLQSGLGDVLGKTIRQVLPVECGLWIATYEKVLDSGQAIRFEWELTGLGRVLELHAFPVGETEQARVGVSFRDVTDRKRSENALRLNRDAFLSLIENAPFGLFVVDAQFRLRHVSKAAQKLFSHVAPAIGRDFKEVIRCVWADPFATDALARFRPYAAIRRVVCCSRPHARPTGRLRCGMVRLEDRAHDAT